MTWDKAVKQKFLRANKEGDFFTRVKSKSLSGTFGLKFNTCKNGRNSRMSTSLKSSFCFVSTKALRHKVYRALMKW